MTTLTQDELKCRGEGHDWPRLDELEGLGLVDDRVIGVPPRDRTDVCSRCGARRNIENGHALYFYPEPKPSIIGRERALTDKVAKQIYTDTHKRYEATKLHEMRRGSYFEIRVVDSDGRWDGHVARITIELDRMEDPNGDHPG